MSATRPRASSPASSISDSELLDNLEDASVGERFDLGGYRERRLQELKLELAQNRMEKDSGRYGRYTEIKEEKVLIETSSKARRCVIHFYHPNFERCRIMHKQLESLVSKYPLTLFLKASVEDSPFLVERLGIKVLPCLISFIDGNARDRIIGFKDLGNQDTFTAAMLEFRLKRSGVLTPPTSDRLLQAAVRAKTSYSDDEEDGDDARDRAGRRKLVRSVRERGGGDGDGDDWD